MDPNKEAATYFFQYGTTIALGTQTAPVAAGGGDKAVPRRRRHRRPRAGRRSTTTGSSPTTTRARRSASGARSRRAASRSASTLVATPNPVKAADSATTLVGTLSGTGNAGRKIVLQASAWPFTTGFVNVTNEQVTNATGGFSFPILCVAVNTQYRVQMPERPQIVSPIVTVGVKPYVKSKVSKKRVKRGKRIRFSGTIKPPAATGSRSRSRRGMARSGSPSAAPSIRSGGKFSKNQKIRRGGTYRVWTGSTTGQYAPNVGKKFKIRSFR